MLRRDFYHRCMPYCRPDEGEHTEIVYTDAVSTAENIRALFAARDRNVLRAEVEPDARLPTEPPSSAKAWLVTWREEDRRA
jgi:hypothetical protein